MFARTSLRAGRTVALTRSYTASTRVLFNGSAAVFQAEPIQSKEVHFRIAAKQAAGKLPDDVAWDNPIQHEVWSEDEVKAVRLTHVDPKTITDKTSLTLAKITRVMFDKVTGYKHEGRLSPAVWLRRLIFLETIAGVPGMVAGMLRHLRSLRRMQRDHGWIHTLLEEAENERMHLLTFLRLRDPGPMFRLVVLGAQGIFFNVFFLSYLVSPQACHRFVGYIEEEAVRTYTRLANDLQTGNLPEWENLPVPSLALSYWRLKPDATMVDLVLAIRRDEANHRDVNHTFASLAADDTNPFVLKHVKESGTPLKKADTTEAPIAH